MNIQQGKVTFTNAVNIIYDVTITVNPFPHNDTFFTPLGNQPFKNTVGKGEIGCDKHYPFPTMFSTRLDNLLPFLSNLKLWSANSFSLEESKISCLVMG